MTFRIQLIEEDGAPMSGRRLRIAQSLNDFLNCIGFPRMGRDDNVVYETTTEGYCICRECGQDLCPIHTETSGLIHNRRRNR